MNRTMVGLALVALGIAIAVISALAHVIGLSFSGSDVPDTFGGKQVGGLVLGIVIIAAGVVLALKSRAEARREGSHAEGDGAA